MGSIPIIMVNKNELYKNNIASLAENRGMTASS
ncbi:hypothetical protein SAMN05421594_2697 [Chryseobacterium oleae]|uniref:Uncharacterized protein n=1 Tax=Chryseobacterium oleae TaxID=491207 RepID=A0A1I4YUJ4_CHROL|nr:hypothetical protein SAMN05421594_2697 [Chryseobacterium oleae]